MDANTPHLVAGPTTRHQLVAIAGESLATVAFAIGIWLVGVAALVGVGLVSWWLAEPIVRVLLFMINPFGVVST